MRVSVWMLCFAGCSVAIPATTSSSCPYANCMVASLIPASLQPFATSLCSSLLKSSLKPVTSTTTTTTTTTKTVVPAVVITTSISTTTTTVVASITCTASATVTVPAPTFVGYTSRGVAPAPVRRDINDAEHDLYRRQTTVPAWISSACAKTVPSLNQIQTACSCLVKPSTTVVTQTSTVTSTTTLVAKTSTITSVSTATVASTTCTSTVTPTVTAIRGCGTSAGPRPAASTSGSLTCANNAAAPSVNARHRIEGNTQEGTIFEDCVLAGPRVITTPSGGTHNCDGTNNAANPAPGTTITDQLDAASKLSPVFSYDGTYSSQFQDYFITSISHTTQTGTQFWGILQNDIFTPSGGCETEVSNSDTSLWAFDAFTVNAFLHIAPDFAAVEAGVGTVTLTVTYTDGNSEIGPYSGASLAGQTTGANGQVTFAVPSVPGCYQYKATANNAIRSNAFYLSVYSSFTGP